MTGKISRKSLFLIAAAGLVIVAGNWLASKYAPIDDSQIEEAQPAHTATPPQETPAPEPEPDLTPRLPSPATPVVIESRDAGHSPFADRINDPTTDIKADLDAIEQILASYRVALGSNPVGNNVEITAQLAGHNRRHLAPLPQNSGAINQLGELVDRWGTPFFFHALSARQMEVRSAGPDRELYTSDDVAWSPVPVASEATVAARKN